MIKFFPREIVLEVTNHCNLRCRFCHFHGEGAKRRRPLGFMGREVFARVLADLARWAPEAEGVSVCFHGAGEPLLHPELRDFLREARRVPGLSLGFMTNAMLLDGSWVDFVLSLPLDWIWFSVDGARPETNDRFRRGAKLAQVEGNIRRLIEERARRGRSLPRISFNFVAYPGVSGEEIEEYLERWLPHADQVVVSRFRPVPSKRLLTPEERARLAPKPCPLLYRQMVIGWDGTYGLCCEDIHLEADLGRVGERGLLEVFNGPELAAIRWSHEHGRREVLGLCHACDVWAADEVLGEREETRTGLRVRVVERPAGVSYLPLRPGG